MRERVWRFVEREFDGFGLAAFIIIALMITMTGTASCLSIIVGAFRCAK